jgi:hypothetical protein
VLSAAVNVLVLALLVGIGCAAHAYRDAILDLTDRIEKLESRVAELSRHVRQIERVEVRPALREAR